MSVTRIVYLAPDDQRSILSDCEPLQHSHTWPSVLELPLEKGCSQCERRTAWIVRGSLKTLHRLAVHTDSIIGYHRYRLDASDALLLWREGLKTLPVRVFGAVARKLRPTPSSRAVCLWRSLASSQRSLNTYRGLPFDRYAK